MGNLHDFPICPRIMLFSCFSVEGGLSLLTLSADVSHTITFTIQTPYVLISSIYAL
jgi:hypothetical protein